MASIARQAVYNPFATAQMQRQMGTQVPTSVLPGQGYLNAIGYQGFGPTEFSFTYGPYGLGSYGYQPGSTMGGYAAPNLAGLMDVVGRRARSFSLT